MSEFKMPDLGEGLQEVEIVSWHVNVGDNIIEDQPLLSVETDKAVVEVPAPQSGTVLELHAKEGELVAVGTVVAAFSDSSKGSGSVVGAVSEEAPEKQEKAVVFSSDFIPPPSALQTTAGGDRRSFGRPRLEAPAVTPAALATPEIRALAREKDIDLAIVTPTGVDNTLTVADVERAAAILESVDFEPLRGVRRAMAQNMTLSHLEVVPANIVDDADVTAWKEGTDVTIRLIRAIGKGCEASPSLNAWFDGRTPGRRLHKHVDLGIAVNSENGLFVPTLRNITKRNADDLRAGINAMREDVKARKIPAEELKGQTITLSNFGMMAGRHAQMVVVPPQVAIIGAGRIEKRPALDERDKVIAKRILPLSLSFDHRAVTGGEAATFLAAMQQDLARSE